MKRLLFVIDHFGSGGAQRQMVTLALGLVARGHDVEFFNYYQEHNFFRHELEQAEITIHDCPKTKKGFSLNVLLALKRLLKTNNYDVALAFLDTPSIYLLLAGIGIRTKLIVSDRNSYLKYNAFNLMVQRQCYRLADYVVANSFFQSDWLINTAKLQSNKVVTIYNGYDPDLFPFSPFFPTGVKDLRLLGIGRINRQKNFENLIRALGIFHAKHGWCPALTWVGKSDSNEYQEKIYKLLVENTNIKTSWKWAGLRCDIPALLADHHALILPSLYEGLPNVVCEAMLAGKPVLVSNVCDNPILVNEGERGFLFNPVEPRDIAQAIEKLIALNREDWERISLNAHNFACSNLSLRKMVSDYENLFENLVTF